MKFTTVGSEGIQIAGSIGIVGQGKERYLQACPGQLTEHVINSDLTPDGQGPGEGRGEHEEPHVPFATRCK